MYRMLLLSSVVHARSASSRILPLKEMSITHQDALKFEPRPVYDRQMLPGSGRLNVVTRVCSLALNLGPKFTHIIRGRDVEIRIRR